MAALSSISRWFRCTRVCRIGPSQWQSGLISGIGDVVAQTYVEDTPFEEIDWMRTVRFATMGLLVTPIIKNSTYRLLYGRYKVQCPMSVPTSIGIEQLMIAPLVNASLIAYGRIITGDQWPQVKDKTKETVVPVTVNGLMVWPAAQLISHAVRRWDPQGLFIAAVGLLWSTYLSHVTLGDGKAEIFNPFAEEDKSKKKTDKKSDKKKKK